MVESNRVVPVVFRTPFDDLAARLFGAMPPSLKRELRRGTDRSFRLGVEYVGNPRLPDDLVIAIFGTGGARASLIAEASKRFAGAHAVGREIPFKLADRYDLAREHAASASQTNGSGTSGSGGEQADRRIRHHPYSIFGQTTLLPGPSVVTEANAATYTNGSGYDFVVTHVTLSQNNWPLVLNPSYRVQFSPQAGKAWTSGTKRIDANAVLTNLLPMPVPNVLSFSACRWNFESAAYVLGKNQGLFATAQNPSAVEYMSVTLMFLATKRNADRTPRLFAGVFAGSRPTDQENGNMLVNGSAATPFNSGDFQNDGDVEAELQEMHITSGIGNWGVQYPTAPMIFVRPSNQREFTAAATFATSLNTTPGNLGGYWRLRQPQRWPTATTMNISLEETTGTGTNPAGGSNIVANVGFLGYLEIPE